MLQNNPCHFRVRSVWRKPAIVLPTLFRISLLSLSMQAISMGTRLLVTNCYGVEFELYEHLGTDNDDDEPPAEYHSMRVAAVTSMHLTPGSKMNSRRERGSISVITYILDFIHIPGLHEGAKSFNAAVLDDISLDGICGSFSKSNRILFTQRTICCSEIG